MRLISLVLAGYACTIWGRRVHKTTQPMHDDAYEDLEVSQEAAMAGRAHLQSTEEAGGLDAIEGLARLFQALKPTAGWQTTGTLRGHADSLPASKSTGKPLVHQPLPSARKAQHQDVHRRAESPAMQAFTFDAFNRDVFRILMDAQSEARVLSAPKVGTQHLLLAATMQKDDVQASLYRMGVTKDVVRNQITGGKANMPGLSGLFASKDELLPFGNDTELCLQASVALTKKERGANQNDLISWSEVILVVLRTEGSEAVKLLNELKINPDEVAKAVKQGKRELVGAGGERRQRKKGDSTLAKCSVDLTQKARDGELDPLIGRSEEVKRAVQILVRRRKNNPVLIGDPGVGKTAIAEGLAQLMVEGQVPAKLLDKRLLSLELGLLVADTKYRGEFEQKMKEVVEEVSQADDIVLFIDELHTLVGAGAADGAIDAANLMKPALARGDLQCVGATTIAEYRKYIEKDAALERRFQPVTIDEPSIDETVEILGGLSNKYEEHHEVEYTPDALQAAVKLSARYLSDRYLPDKAIDLMDEAGSLKQMQLFQNNESPGAENPKVDEEDVAAVISAWTGIPLSKLSEDEASNMLEFEGNLHQRVIGQNFAVSAISRALRRARVGLRSPTRPVASMIFCGPTGVGKTELAKAVAELYYGEEKAMIRLDMSEYMEAFSVSRLTGPPPGYVGYDEGGQLTGAVRKKPHTVILFDEVEKAHPDVFNTLLQVLDDGRLTDNKGRVVDFSNAMLILTSNVGSKRILKLTNRATGQDREKEYAKLRSAVKEELNKGFRPEFLNRLDEVIVFEVLNEQEVGSIADIMLKELVKRCKENEIELETTQQLTNALVDEGYSPNFGARPLRRAVQRFCEDAVADAVLKGFAKTGETLKLDHDGKGNIIMTNQEGKVVRFVPQYAQGIEEDTAPSKESTPDVEVLPPAEDSSNFARIKPKDFGNFDR